MTAVPDGLLDWARLPGPTKVLDRTRRRLEAGGSIAGSPLPVSLTPAERRDVGRLLGSAWELSQRAVPLRQLAERIEELGTDLPSLLTALHGPLVDRPAERAARRSAAQMERRAAAEELRAAGLPDDVINGWMSAAALPAAGSGRLHRLASQAAAVLRTLPAPGDTTLLAVLAADALDDPHALDRDTRLGATVLRLAHRGELPDSARREAEAWRAAWEHLGVVCDELSSRVLVLNLDLRGDAAATHLTGAAGAEPVWLTWRSLRGTFTSPATDVYVCENPAVLAAAADRLGVSSRPLICTNGRPTCAARRLIAVLAAAGVRLWIRADDDPAGQQIVNEVHMIAPAAQLWRYERRDATDGQRRYEEQDLPLLLADLTASD
ncbi:TIGR02679 domain-containing protein [Dactylosporangium darangshiense]|uniref:DUF2399 domain-containing protein n=2 Tax=Dactylosporangium darangshiense TaxID=579108 RepID=A0ABP8DHX6_9ACTN